MTLSEALRQAIDDSGQTLYRIAKDGGIDQGVMNRFYHGTDARLSTADKLAEYLGLELRPVKKRKQ